MPEDGAALGGGEMAAALPAGDRRCDLDGGDAGDIERVGGLDAGKGTHPGAAGFRDMAFDQGAAVEARERTDIADFWLPPKLFSTKWLW